MSESFSQLLRQIANSPEVGGLVAAILLGALLFFWFWVRPAFRSIESALESLRSVLADAHDWSQAVANAKTRLLPNPAVSSAWDETQSRVVAIEAPDGQAGHATFGPPSDIWNPQQLVGRSINLPLAEAVPNLLVGIGLLLTFAFLTLAIVSATAALDRSSASTVVTPDRDPSPQAATPKRQQSSSASAEVSQIGASSGQEGFNNAISNLLSSAGAKFLTSLAGLLASIAWTVFFRRRMRGIGAHCDAVVHRIASLAPPDAGERLAQSQFEHARFARRSSEDRRLLAEETLQEAREQTGTLKRFETDLAVSIARAINAGLAPKFEEMTDKLTQSIDRLSERMAAINQGALEQMLKDFAALLEKATKTEMTALQKTLGDLAETLQIVAGKLEKAGTETGQKIGEASDMLIKRIGEITDQLLSAARGLVDTHQSLHESVGSLAVTVERASEAGEEGRNFVAHALAEAAQHLGRFDGATKSLESATSNLTQVNAAIERAVQVIQSLATEQRQVVQAVKDATPAAMARIETVLTTLDQTVGMTKSAVSGIKESMTSTTNALQQTVASITGGVTQYSETVSMLHKRLDSHLATAIGQLGHKISSLEEVLEELAEVTGQLSSKGQK